MKALLIILFGILGVSSRYLIEENLNHLYYLGTIGVNLAGSLIAGILYYHIQTKGSPYLLTIVIGFCGAVTTLSGHSLISFMEFQKNNYINSLALLIGIPVLSFLLLGAGYAMARTYWP